MADHEPLKTMTELEADPEFRSAVRAMKEQMLIVFTKRAGGRVVIPVAEVNDTGNDVLIMEMDGTNFVFTTGLKQ